MYQKRRRMSSVERRDYMYKRILVFLLLFIMTLTAASCGKQPAEVPLDGEISALASEFVAMLAVEDFVGAVSYFDSKMKQALPEAKLKKTWQDLQQQVGQFKGEVGQRTDQADGYDIIFVTTQFENALLDIRVVFGSNKRIAGLFFQPANGQSLSPYTPPSYVEIDTFKATNVTIGSGEWALPGTLTIPNGNGPFPVVVLVHGSGPNDRDETIGPNKPFKDLAWGLATQGIATLRYEKRTREHGQKMASQQETITPKEEVVDDVLAAVALLKDTARIDPNRIYVLGHSLGGTLAPRIGAMDRDIAGLIILAGTPRPLQDIILEQYHYLASLDGTITAEEQTQLDLIQTQADRVRDPALSANTPAAELPLGMPASYWLYLRDYNPGQTADALPIPMLILQGERDYQVTMQDFAQWRQALQSRTNVTFKSYPPLNHLFITGTGPSTPQEYLQQGNIAKEVIDDIATWLKDQ